MSTRRKHFSVAQGFAAVLASALVGSLVVVALLLAVRARAQQPVGGLYADACLNPNVRTIVTPVSIAAAGTTLLATAPAQGLSICTMTLTLGGTTPSVELETGTQTTSPCDTGAQAVTGVMAPTAGSVLRLSGPRAVLNLSGAVQVCIVVAGTAPSVQGVMASAHN